MKNNIYDLIIVGGGPAGISAGIYAARQKLKTLLIAKNFGGQVAKKAVDIENYPGFSKISGKELIEKFEKHLAGFEIDIERDLVKIIKKDNNDFFVITENNREFKAKTIIVASGANPRLLDIPGEKEFIGKGVSYCSVCDGPMFSNKIVAVVGGGDAGFETAISLNNWVKKIYLLEYAPKVVADARNQETVSKIDKIKIMTNVILKEIKGEVFVNSVIIQDRESKKESDLKLDGIFVEIGSIPATYFVSPVRNSEGSQRKISNGVKDLVDFNKKGEIKINPETCMTKTDGLFSAGDVTEIKEKQIIIAAGEGAKAALSAYKYLQRN